MCCINISRKTHLIRITSKALQLSIPTMNWLIHYGKEATLFLEIEFLSLKFSFSIFSEMTLALSHTSPKAILIEQI